MRTRRCEGTRALGREGRGSGAPAREGRASGPFLRSRLDRAIGRLLYWGAAFVARFAGAAARAIANNEEPAS